MVSGFTFTFPVDAVFTETINGEKVPSGYATMFAGIYKYGDGVDYLLTSSRTGIQWGVEYGLKISGRDDIEFEYLVFDDEFLVAVGSLHIFRCRQKLTILQRAIQFLIDVSEKGHTLIGGNIFSEILSVTGQAGSVYNVALLSSQASSSALSDKIKYPYVTRNCVANPLITGGTAAMIGSLRDQYGRGWDRVAILSTSEEYALNMASSLISRLSAIDIEVATYQQFVPETGQLDTQMREIERSGARVIVVFAISQYDNVLRKAKELNLIDENHAWFVGTAIAITTTYYINPDGSVDEEILELLRGQVGGRDYFSRTGPAYDNLVERWNAADQLGGELSVTLIQNFDMGYTTVLSVIQAYDEGLFDDGKSPRPEDWSRIIRGLEFEGASGFVKFLPNGDRIMPAAVINFKPEQLKWTEAGYWSEEEGLVLEEDIVWFDNTTQIPDLDIRSPVTYWSCDDAEMKEDPTGKTVPIHKPDRHGAHNIAESYHCDHFIDCDNMSDESGHCSANYKVTFIVFGVITGILILFSCCLIPVVLFFGYVVRRKRIRASSPPFLILICLSCAVGFASTYAWYGKPHPVACGFQPWLLGLSVVSLISALSSKTWRLWRLFSINAKRSLVISDLYLLLLYSLLVLPALVILIVWTIVSTPTAKLEEHSDGNDHYVCTTGGFTGTPGGLIFFFILVGYEAVVLLFAAFLSIVTRNVPSFFNESKLIAISIYNLGLLAAVVIPVFMVLQEFNPFAAWIIRTVAILYAFAATLFLQFVPKLFGILILDRGRDVTLNEVSLGKTRRVAAFMTTSSESMDSSFPTSASGQTTLDG